MPDAGFPALPEGMEAWEPPRAAEPVGAVRAARDPLDCRPIAEGVGALALDTPYFVKGLLHPGDLALIVGPPGCGKTTIAPDLAWHVAAGLPFLGRRARPAPVLYAPLEDRNGLMRRFAALARERGAPPPVFVATRPINLLADGAEAVSRAAEACGCGVAIIDTLNAAAPGLDENSPADMGRVVAALRGITSPKRAVVVLHHTPRSGQHPRGHGALEAAADTIATVLPPETEAAPRRLHIAKNRHGPAGEQWGFSIKAVALGLDSDGDELAGIVPEWGDRAPRVAPETLPPKARLALRHLHDLLCDAGREPPPPWRLPPGLRVVPLDAWRARCRERGLSESADAFRQTFRRAYETLMARGRIAARDFEGTTLVWAARAAREGQADP